VSHSQCVAIYLQAAVSVFLNWAPMDKMEDLCVTLCIPFGNTFHC